ncbi:MBL fold metallo-hydrolase [Bordetella genomosp. 5]|uniref:Hydrolase n=1 Tax=Bordetella genomosp. 5 TaxID=1395608 RepID=A0A261TVH7_9BORD|nr:MBL fold metallo-hydrolase [Bordetella genomosp. 5]OZI53688.1 hydrolase [Bordetella genomosp. 5]
MTSCLLTRTPIAAYPTSPQSVGTGFANPVPKPNDSLGKTLRIIWDVLLHKPAGTRPAGAVPVQALSAEALAAAPLHSLYRLGHSTLLIKLANGWWLTDPVFSERASPVQWAGPKRFHAPPIALEDLPPLRGVLLSHDHYDHLDHATIQYLAERAQVFLTPLGVGDRLIAWGVASERVRQFDWWQEAEIDGVRFAATPAQHFSGRGLRDGNRTLWASWAVLDQGLRLFFSGDTGYHAGFREIGERYGPFDVTFLETGAYNAQWAYVHMQPEETVQAHRDLQGRWLMPIHNGTFDLAMHTWDEPFERVAVLASQAGIPLATPQMGERLDLRAPHPGRAWWREAAR